MVIRMFEVSWDAGLTEAQLAAASHGDRPLIIRAGAGTGKTRTLVARLAALVDRGVDPERILLLTFTRRAAADMLSRAAAVCGRRDASRKLTGGTFHSVGYRVVAAHAVALGLSPQLSVLDTADSRDVFDLLRHDFGLAGTKERMPRADTLADIYSRTVNTGTPARQVIATQFPWCEAHLAAILEVFRAYGDRKRTQSLLDFDDLLLSWRALLADPTLGPALSGRYDHVLVDEYQDVNRIQVDIVRLLTGDGTGLTVVGDDAQAIYGFRGADSRHLVELTKELPAARTVSLEQNFRSQPRILALANAVRPSEGGENLELRSDRGAAGRPQLMRCYDAGAEARAVVDAVLEAAENGRRLRDQAVLMRAAHHSDLLEVELTARAVPFVKYGGLKFLESAHVKDFLAAARLVENPSDEIAWFRLLKMHDGVGPARARELLGVLRPADPDSEGRAADTVAAAPPAARVALAASLSGLALARRTAGVAGKAEAVVALVRPLITAAYTDHAARLGDLERLLTAAEDAPSLADFVAQLTMDPPASTSDLAQPPHLDEDYLVLSTVHSAKGLEWDAVHIIGVVDGQFPSDMALASDTGLIEEQRLFYVAVTRARDTLAVYTPLRMPHHRRSFDDRHSFALQSRFLTAEAWPTLELHEVNPPRAAAAGCAVAARVTPPNLDALWA